MTRKKNGYYHLTIPVLILGNGIFFSCSNSIDDINAASDLSELPMQTIKDGKFDYTEKGKLINHLEAGEFNQFKNQDLLASKGVEMTIFNRSEQVEAILTSINGTYKKQENILIARDSVKLRNIDGDYLLTEELTLYQDSNLIKTDQPVEIHKGDNVIFGEGLTADASFTRYQIKNPARSRIVIPKDSLEQDNE